MDVRDLLRVALDDRGYNKSAVARKANIPLNKFSASLQKRRKLDANEFISICEATGLTVGELKKYVDTLQAS